MSMERRKMLLEFENGSTTELKGVQIPIASLSKDDLLSIIRGQLFAHQREIIIRKANEKPIPISSETLREIRSSSPEEQEKMIETIANEAKEANILFIRKIPIKTS